MHMSEGYKPSFTMTEEITNLVIEIAEMTGRFDYSVAGTYKCGGQPWDHSECPVQRRNLCGCLKGDKPSSGEHWIGVPYWGQGLIPEVMWGLMRYTFEELHMEKLWCGYFDGNEKSWRAQDKCGFIYHHTNKDIHWKLMDDIRTEHVSCITKEQWRTNHEK